MKITNIHKQRQKHDSTNMNRLDHQRISMLQGAIRRWVEKTAFLTSPLGTFFQLVQNLNRKVARFLVLVLDLASGKLLVPFLQGSESVLMIQARLTIFVLGGPFEHGPFLSEVELEECSRAFCNN